MISPELGRAADVLVRDQMCIEADENVVILTDTAGDLTACQAIMNAAFAVRARPTLLIMPQLPYQGSLADPYVPPTIAAALEACDVWIDLTFPYLAGSKVHDDFMQAKRGRYLLGGDLHAGGMTRLYGRTDMDWLFSVQSVFDTLMAESVGKSCRITNRLGTNVEFKFAKPGAAKLRHANRPSLNVVPGSGMIYPDPDTVKGTIVVGNLFHEYYVTLPEPVTVTVDGQIEQVRGGGEEIVPFERALKRGGGGKFGRIIHLSCGLHPAARSGVSLIEDIRVLGSNAVGFGTPWWEPGGGENHPDGIASMQSIWIDGEPIMTDGRFVGPSNLVALYAEL